MTLRWTRWCLVFIAALSSIAESAAPYFGTKIGSFKTYVHDVVGDVYAVDDRTIFIKGFSYDGQGPDAYFWGGSSSKPDTSGFIIPDEKGKKTPLKEYRFKDLLLRLPAGKTLRNVNWISVWCRKFSANFGEIFIPENLLIPQPVEIGRIPTKEHGVSSGPVMVVDTQTLLVPEFTYDGLGPAAYWWVSRGARQHPRGLRLADENGSYTPLKKYTGKTVVITLPDENTIYDYDWFGVWCEEARVDFGSVALPQHIIVPPSPRTLGIELEYKLNCEVLHDDIGYEIRWIMDGEDIVMQFVGRIEPGEYMSFGLSKNDTKSEMTKADAIVAWIDKKKKGHAVDYYLGSKEQCVGRRGSCPDVKFPDGQDSVTLLNAAVVNGYTMITLKRPQVGLDEKYDQHVYSDGPQAVVWAVGPLNDKDEVSYHGILRSEGDIYIDFARPPEWNCPQPSDPEQVQQPTPSTTTTTTTTKKPTKRPSAVDRSRKPKPTSESSRRKPQPIGPRYASRASDVRLSASNVNTAWNVPPIMCPSDRTFRAQIGPTGGKKGYQSITGDVGWGIAWYINGVLIPEITVERGKTYTFIVEGGNDPENQAKTHPLYITDDPEGGFEYKTAAERKKVKVYAGVSKDRRGTYSATAMGRLCEWKLPNDMTAEDFDTFDDFQESLELKCERGKAGRLTFKPDKDTPDLLYYQCYTHRHLGWKIHVVDSCTDSKGLHHEASIQHIRNITYNSFTDDLQEGKKESALEDDSSDDFNRPSKYDGTPFDPYSNHKDVKDYDKDLATEDPEDRKRLYYRPSSYYSSQKYFYPSSTKPPPSSLYYKPSTTSSRNYYYSTDDSKSFYYKTSTTTRPPTTRTTTKKPTPTMESFKMRDVVDLNNKKVNYYINTPPTQKPTGGIKTIILNPGQPGNLKLRVFISTPSPQPTQPSYTHVKGRSQWWNQPTQSSSTTHQKAINNLRTQLSVIQNTKQRPSPALNNPSFIRQPYNTHYEKSFIPVVIKHNSTFDAVVSGAPSQNPHFHQHVNPPSQILALSTTNHNGKSIVPVLIRAKETIKRTSTDTNRNRGIQTPLGNLPYPNSPTKKKPIADVSGKAGDPSFLPLLVPQKPSNKSSAGTKKKSPAPLIPLVTPEKKDDNLYILHQMLSLLNENPQSIAARGIKIVGTSDKNVRTRVIRSADHNHKHSMTGHEHEDHDHNHEGHEMHHKDHSKKSSGSKYSLSRFLFLSAILFIRYFKRMLF